MRSGLSVIHGCLSFTRMSVLAIVPFPGCPPSYLCLPHQPELEDVHVTATLNRLVPGIIGDVILLVWLEEVACTHLVASLEYTLSQKSRHKQLHSPVRDEGARMDLGTRVFSSEAFRGFRCPSKLLLETPRLPAPNPCLALCGSC